MAKENAFLMAAGMGTRMAPLTKRVPKPLVKAKKTPLIKTIIDGLETRDIDQIYVVVGYLGSQFAYLEKEYPNLTIIENTEYLTKNNISSVCLIADKLREADAFICEADLFVSDQSIFNKNLEKSCYFGKRVKGRSDDWVLDTNSDGRIVRIGKGGRDTYNMAGISYFKQQDASILADVITKACQEPGYEQLFWDEVVNKNLDKLKLAVNLVDENQIIEIDTLAELAAFDPDYEKYN